jgi:hypothetical protein
MGGCSLQKGVTTDRHRFSRPLRNTCS